MIVTISCYGATQSTMSLFIFGRKSEYGRGAVRIEQAGFETLSVRSFSIILFLIHDFKQPTVQRYVSTMIGAAQVKRVHKG